MVNLHKKVKVNLTKKTCTNCHYYNACGDSERTAPCKGRKNKESDCNGK